MPIIPIKLCALLLILSGHAFAQAPMVLGVPELKPYTYLEDGQIKGQILAIVDTIFNKSQIQYEVKFLDNYSSLLKAIKKHEIDGFFIATQNIERDRYGTFSKPILMDRYTWFIMKNAKFEFGSEDFLYKAKIGAVENTNSFRLATRRGYQVFGQPSEILAHNFIQKNVDAVFAAHLPFQYHLDKLELNKKEYRVVVDSVRPFGLYISKKYLLNRPHLMETINSHIQTLKK